MSLDPISRGALEGIIDGVIQRIPDYTNNIRTKQSTLHVKDVETFVYGMAYGECFSAFIMNFLSIYRRDLTEQEANELKQIVDRRAGEIREAVFKTG